MSYSRKNNVWNASLNKTFPSFFLYGCLILLTRCWQENVLKCTLLTLYRELIFITLDNIILPAVVSRLTTFEGMYPVIHLKPRWDWVQIPELIPLSSSPDQIFQICSSRYTLTSVGNKCINKSKTKNYSFKTYSF